MRRIVLACLLVALAAAACVDAGAAKPALTIGAIYPLSGSQTEGGHEELAGVQAALAVAKQQGLTDAANVRLEVTDAATPSQAIAAVDRYHSQGLPMVIGTYGSTLAGPAAAEADRLHMVYWETGAVADSVTLGRSYVFRTVATGGDLGRMAADFAGRVIGHGSAVIVQVGDVYGNSVADAEALEAAQVGLTIIDRITYQVDSLSAAGIASRLAFDHPDYLLDVSYLDDGVAIWQAIVSQSVKLKAAIGTSSAFCMPLFGQRLGSLAVGVFAADKPDAGINTQALSPAGRALLHEAVAEYAKENKGAAMEIPSVAGFVGMWTLLHDVLSHAGGAATADSIRAAAQQVDVPVGDEINGGGVRFDSRGENIRDASVVGQWQAVDVMRTVYPATFADATPMPISR